MKLNINLLIFKIRFADGRAVLRSSIREFLASEAMYYLGIPTTRAGSIIVANDRVIRDPLYKNKQILEPVSIVMRMAPNFIRFGSFEICKISDFNSGPSKNMD